MIKKNDRYHSIDVFFVVCIFLVLGLSICLVLVFGMRSYERITAGTDDNYQLRTSLLYVSNKIKAFDEDGSISTEKFNNGDALVFQQEIDGTKYVTRIYNYENTLMELFTEAENNLEPIAGTPITEVSDFKVEEIDDKLLKITVTSPDGNEKNIVSSIH